MVSTIYLECVLVKGNNLRKVLAQCWARVWVSKTIIFSISHPKHIHVYTRVYAQTQAHAHTYMQNLTAHTCTPITLTHSHCALTVLICMNAWKCWD